MNLDSYTRLNPYFEDEDVNGGSERGYTWVAFGVVVVLIILGAYALVQVDVVG